MGSTNKTTNYELSQFVGTDKPSWLSDYNNDMSKIDTAIKARSVEASAAQTTADTANGKADALDTRMDTAENNITALQNASTTDHTQIATNTANISKNAQDIVQLDAKIGHTQITIGDHTVTGAIAELAARPVTGDADDISYDNTASDLTATNVQGAIDELASKPASNVRWNTTTDRFEVLKNGSWVQSIRAFVNSIAVWVAGVFGIDVDNGTHAYSSTAGATIPFTVNDANLVRDGQTAQAGSVATLVSKNLIDFTNYARITVKNDKTSDVVLDVSDLNTTGYLCIYATIGFSENVLVGIEVSTQKDNFDQNIITGHKAEKTVTGPTTTTIKISEITIE